MVNKCYVFSTFTAAGYGGQSVLRVCVGFEFVGVWDNYGTWKYNDLSDSERMTRSASWRRANDTTAGCN